MKTLEIEGKKTKLNLLATGQEKIQSSYVVSGLEVSIPSGENALELQPDFTRSTPPMSKNGLISSKDIQKYFRLHDIPLEMIDSGVDLFIAVHCPKYDENMEYCS